MLRKTLSAALLIQIMIAGGAYAYTYERDNADDIRQGTENDMAVENQINRSVSLKRDLPAADITEEINRELDRKNIYDRDDEYSEYTGNDEYIPSDSSDTRTGNGDSAAQNKTSDANKTKTAVTDHSPNVKVFGTNTPTFKGSRQEATDYLNERRDAGAYDYDVNYNHGISTDPYYNYNGAYNDPYYYGNGYPRPSVPGEPVFYYQSKNGPVPVYRIYRRDPVTGALIPYFVFANGQDASDVLPPGMRPLPGDPSVPSGSLPPHPGYGPDPVDPGFTHPGDRPVRPYPPHPGYRPDPVDPGFTHPGDRPVRPYPPYPGYRPNPADPGFTHPGDRLPRPSPGYGRAPDAGYAVP